MLRYGIGAAVVLAASAAFAQGDAPAPDSAQALLIGLITAATPVVIAAVKWGVPRIPTVWLPVLAPCVGAVVEVLAYAASGTGVPTWAAATAGLAGVGLRELVDQVKQRLRGMSESAQ